MRTHLSGEANLLERTCVKGIMRLWWLHLKSLAPRWHHPRPWCDPSDFALIHSPPHITATPRGNCLSPDWLKFNCARLSERWKTTKSSQRLWIGYDREEETLFFVAAIWIHWEEILSHWCFSFVFFMWNKKSKVYSKIGLLTEKWAEEEKKGNLNRGKKAEINQTWFCAHVLFIQVLQMQPTSTSRLFSCNKKPLAKHEKGFWKNKKFWREHLLCWESQQESGCKIFPCEHLNGSAGFYSWVKVTSERRKRAESKWNQ